MGMYTELVMAVKLDKSTPDDVIDILKYMCRERDSEPTLIYFNYFDKLNKKYVPVGLLDVVVGLECRIRPLEARRDYV